MKKGKLSGLFPPYGAQVSFIINLSTFRVSGVDVNINCVEDDTERREGQGVTDTAKFVQRSEEGFEKLVLWFGAYCILLGLVLNCGSSSVSHETSVASLKNIDENFVQRSRGGVPHSLVFCVDRNILWL